MSELPTQSAPVEVAPGRTACEQTRTLVGSGGPGRAVALGIAGIVAVASVVVGLVDPRGWFGLIAVIVLIVVAVRAGQRGWALTPDGIVRTGGSVTRWGEVAEFGVQVKLSSSQRREYAPKELWFTGLRTQRGGVENLDGASTSSTAQRQRVERTVAAAWLVGAVPPDVAVVVDRPGRHDGRNPQLVLEAADPSERGVAHAPAEAHGAGLAHLDRLAPPR